MMGIVRKNYLEKLIEVLDKLLQFRWTTQISRDNASGNIPLTGSLTHIDKMVDTIKSKAPRWVSILQNFSYPPANPTGEVPFGKFTVILPMLCNHMHRNTSDAFPAIMSLYLFQAGCRRRGIELFNCLGLCRSYRPTRKFVLNLCEQGQQKLLQLGPNPTTVMTYDNFEYTDGTSACMANIDDSLTV